MYPLAVPVFAVIFAFKGKQSVTPSDALICYRRRPQRSVSRQGFYKLSPDMGKTSAPFSLRQSVVTIIAITDDITVIISEKRNGIFSASGLTIIVQHDILFTARRTAVHPHTRLGFGASTRCFSKGNTFLGSTQYLSPCLSENTNG